MKVVFAPDSFKESITSVEAAEAMAQGIHRVDPTIECPLVPMADRGEDTIQALVAALAASGSRPHATMHSADRQRGGTDSCRVIS